MKKQNSAIGAALGCRRALVLDYFNQARPTDFEQVELRVELSRINDREGDAILARI